MAGPQHLTTHSQSHCAIWCLPAQKLDVAHTPENDALDASVRHRQPAQPLAAADNQPADGPLHSSSQPVQPVLIPAPPLPLLCLTAQQLASLTAMSTPHRLRGAVVEGFGRGSKLLGCPTANLDPASFRGLLTDVPRGVYMGWAQVGGAGQPVYKTVLSLGTNPSFADSREDTVESYLLHDFPGDFYGQQIALVIVAFMRPMEKYNGLGPLIKAIERDVRVGDRALDLDQFRAFKEDEWFKSAADSSSTSA